MSRAFGFNIDKPQGTVGIPGRLLTDLTAKYPQLDTSTPDSEGYHTILEKLYPSGISSREITFDRGFSRESTHRVLTASFGDGYQQRVRDGINTKVDKFSVTLSNRIWQEIALISSFFDVIHPQSFQINMERENFKVVLDTYSVMVGHDDVQSISADLSRVYEA
jgi:phage-related protein